MPALSHNNCALLGASCEIVWNARSHSSSFAEHRGISTCATMRHALCGNCAGSGDVKYHLGTSFDRPTTYGKHVHLSLLANPSHLEAVNPVVLGKCRARQFYEDDPEGRATMPILLHGDGSFSGQVRYRCIHY